jgi:hypothetical protein
MEKTTQEGNRLLALFMGAEEQQWYPSSLMYEQSGVHFSFPKDNYPNNERYHGLKELKYHLKFDWLMPVWFKYQSLSIKKLTEDEVIAFWMYHGFISGAIISSHDNTPQAAFEELVKAVEWYNSLKK